MDSQHTAWSTSSPALPSQSSTLVASSISVVWVPSRDLKPTRQTGVHIKGVDDTDRRQRARPAVVNRRLLHVSFVLSGRPPLNTDWFNSSNSFWAYASRRACSAASRAFLETLGALPFLLGFLGVGVRGGDGRSASDSESCEGSLNFGLGGISLG